MKNFCPLTQLYQALVTKSDNTINYLLSNHNDLIPIVRTTTCYKQPVQNFTNKCRELFKDCNLRCNNIMAEIYTDQYNTMNFHTDQTQDLEPDSLIAIISFYDKNNSSRILEIKHKNDKSIQQIKMENNSIIVFSIETNKNFVHRIVLDKPNGNKWLGLTCRLSKTHIRFINEIPYLVSNNRQLLLANESQKKQIYIYKSQENKTTDYFYEWSDYTLSSSDLTIPNFLISQ